VLSGAAGCAATQPEYGDVPPKRRLSEIADPTEPGLFVDVYDPWEGYNRWMYDVNARLERYVVIPVVEGYKRFVPQFLRSGLRNAYQNYFEFSNFGNALLQGRPVLAARVLGRFVVNSTLGLGGLLDPAEAMGLLHQREDFGQTLARWGVGPGPYLVLPLLGPSSLRDASGFGIDTIAVAEVDLFGFMDWASENRWVWIIWGVDYRSNIDFRYYESGSPFEYLLVRRLYLDLREIETAR
jgi:phospholipid-binding lipoprotein MlaA